MNSRFDRASTLPLRISCRLKREYCCRFTLLSSAYYITNKVFFLVADLFILGNFPGAQE